MFLKKERFYSVLKLTMTGKNTRSLDARLDWIRQFKRLVGMTVDFQSSESASFIAP